MNAISHDGFFKITTILLAEDDQDDQEFITNALAAINPRLTIHAISKSSSVINFLQNLTDTQLPQLIILDYNLPEIDGAELLQQLTAHQRYQAIPKIVWSTSNSPQYKTRCLESGAAQYLVKPSTIADIEAMARQMLGACQATA